MAARPSGGLGHGDPVGNPARADRDDVEFLGIDHAPVVGIEMGDAEPLTGFLQSLRVVVGDRHDLGVGGVVKRGIESVAVVALAC